jgi:hypothetical protein
LTQKLSAAANGANHSELLDALLQLTIRVAKTHTCCTRDAATGLLLASSHLQAHMLKHPLVYAQNPAKTTH